MNWFVVGCVLLCMGGAAEMGAINRGPGSTEEQCINENLVPVVIPEPQFGPECLAGSNWTSVCNMCYCNQKGRKICTQNVCEGRSNELERNCAKDTKWKNDCNSCFCTDTGLNACTLMLCQSTYVPRDIKSKPKRSTTDSLPAQAECRPESTWQSNCNECRCADGTAICQKMEKCESKSEESVARCAPESTWENDCNTCWCMNGTAFCTKIGCDGYIITDFLDDRKGNEGNNEQIPEFRLLDHNIIKREVCKANQNFKNECNNCKCSSDGLSYHCTQNECMEAVDRDVEVFMESEGSDHIERHSVCQPRSNFHVNCNTCVCNQHGTDYACTNKACPLPEDVELFHELRVTKSPINQTKVCSAKRMFIKDCNTCWCNDDGTSFYCTRKVCVPNLPDETQSEEKPEDLRIIKRKCRPDEVFEIDCNMCRCNPDGESFSCTRRACFIDPPTEVVDYEVKKFSRRRIVRAVPTQEAPKACTPGQEFRMDCNTCLCDNEGQDFSCTRIDCNNNNKPSRRKREVAKQEMKQCEPGGVFEQDCNVCRCASDGRHATCTLKRCDLKPAQENGNNYADNSLVEADPDFRCNPGEQFKRGCNDCTCSADGKSVFCTILLCDRDIGSKI